MISNLSRNVARVIIKYQIDHSFHHIQLQSLQVPNCEQSLKSCLVDMIVPNDLHISTCRFSRPASKQTLSRRQKSISHHRLHFTYPLNYACLADCLICSITSRPIRPTITLSTKQLGPATITHSTISTWIVMISDPVRKPLGLH